MKKIRSISAVLIFALVAGIGICVSGCGETENIYKVSNEAELTSALQKEDEVIKIQFTSNIVADIEIVKNKEVVIDLNGNKLTNTESHTIINNGKLTVKDTSKSKTGIIDNVTHQKASLYNEVGAELVVESGNFTRSLENGKTNESSGNNSFYVLLNHGNTVINGGKFFNDGSYSSLIENGWYTPSQNTTQVESVMIINGGNFEGGKNTIKNDDYGVMTINGGKFQNKMPNSTAENATSIVLNWNELKINGGEFVANYCKYVIFTGYKGNETFEKGTTIISNGTVSGNITTADIYAFYTNANYENGTLTGEFTGTVTLNATLNA